MNHQTPSSPAGWPEHATPVVESPRDIRRVFLGPNGLRAGWGVLLFLIVFIAVNRLLAWAFLPFYHHLLPPDAHAKSENSPMPLAVGYLMESIMAACVVIATAVMARIEHLPLLSFGFQGRARSSRFFFGLVYGFAAVSIFVYVLAKAGLLSIDGRLLHGSAIWKDAAGWGLFFILVAVFEEAALRGYLQYTLTRGIGFWWSALLLSFLFGFAHGTNPGETPVGLFSAGAIGLVFCLSLWYTGSLWWALGFHAAWDWGESFFYGTSDSGMIVQGHLLAEHPTGKILWSGGATGPEGSLLVLPLILLIAFCMWLWWGPRTVSPFSGAALGPRRSFAEPKPAAEAA